MLLWASQGWMGGHFHRSGIWVEWEGATFMRTGLGAPPSGAYIAGAAQVLIPGMINAHAHLELTDLAGRLPVGIPFCTWVDALREGLLTWSDSDWYASAARGCAESLRWGTTTVCDVGNAPAARRAFVDSPLRVLAHAEVMGRSEARARQQWQLVEDSGVRRVSLHSAYAAHPWLVGQTLQWCRERGQVWMLHFAESREEDQYLRTGSGPMADWLLQRFGVAASSPVGGDPAAWLRAQTPHKLLLVHGNTLTAQDLEALRGLDVGVVHCPQSHHWFEHPEFPWESCAQLQIPVALGTDSLASAYSLDMRAQVRTLLARQPGISPAHAMDMCTRIGAKVLGFEGELGDLQSGLSADFALLELPPGADMASAIFSEETRVSLVVGAGRRVWTAPDCEITGEFLSLQP